MKDVDPLVCKKIFFTNKGQIRYLPKIFSNMFYDTEHVLLWMIFYTPSWKGICRDCVSQERRYPYVTQFFGFGSGGFRQSKILTLNDMMGNWKCGPWPGTRREFSLCWVHLVVGISLYRWVWSRPSQWPFIVTTTTVPRNRKIRDLNRVLKTKYRPVFYDTLTTNRPPW